MSTQNIITTKPSFIVKTDANYVKSLNSVICVVEAVLCLAAFVMAAILGSTRWVTLMTPVFGMGSTVPYIQFTTVCGFLQAVVFFFTNLFMPSIPDYKPDGTIIEILLSVVWFLLLLIAGVVATFFSTMFNDVNNLFGNTYKVMAASAALNFSCAVVYGVGCRVLFKDWRSQNKQYY